MDWPGKTRWTFASAAVAVVSAAIPSNTQRERTLMPDLQGTVPLAPPVPFYADDLRLSIPMLGDPPPQRVVRARDLD
jgi:hypothetical protein